MALYSTQSALHDFKILLDQLNLAAVLNSGLTTHFSINLLEKMEVSYPH